MYQRSKITDSRSLINNSYLLQDDIGLIGIYGTDDERFIYIELGASNHIIDKYTIQFKNGFLSASSASDLGLSWKYASTVATLDTVSEIIKVKERAIHQREFQASSQEISVFKDMMNETMQAYSLNGEQDEDINRALRAINQNEFVTRKSSSMVFFTYC